MDAIAGIVAALAPDHAGHHGHEMTASVAGDVEVKCPCGVRLTFLASQLAALTPKGEHKGYHIPHKPKAVGDGS